jgi:hypothetical protein
MSHVRQPEFKRKYMRKLKHHTTRTELFSYIKAIIIKDRLFRVPEG